MAETQKQRSNRLAREGLAERNALARHAAPTTVGRELRPDREAQRKAAK